MMATNSMNGSEWDDSALLQAFDNAVHSHGVEADAANGDSSGAEDSYWRTSAVERRDEPASRGAAETDPAQQRPTLSEAEAAGQEYLAWRQRDAPSYFHAATPVPAGAAAPAPASAPAPAPVPAPAQAPGAGFAPMAPPTAGRGTPIDAPLPVTQEELSDLLHAWYHAGFATGRLQAVAELRAKGRLRE